MPKLSANFGPIPVRVTLDGSGNGTATFQPNGNNARITTLFVKVATSTLQATVNIYKGQVADTSIIGSTPSGSTGAPAFGNIDLVDGETLYVVWTGGDVGAVATATFVGQTIPFSEVGGSTLRWSDPIAANDGSLIFPAIKSPNYVAGTAGWIVKRNGDVEFNNAVIRGSVSAGGGNVLLNANGYTQTGSFGKQFKINGNAGFLAQRDPTDGSAAQMIVNLGSFGDSWGGVTYYTPTTPTTNNANNIDSGHVMAQYDEAGATDRPLITIRSPTITGLESALIDLFGQRSTSATDDSEITLDASIVNTTESFRIRGNDGGRGIISSGGMAGSSAAIGNTETDLFTCSAFTFKAERAYALKAAGMHTVSVASNRPLYRLRKSSGGTQIIAKSIFNGVAGAQNQADWLGFFYVTGADVTASPVVSVIGSAAFTVTVLGPYGVTIEDIGPSSRVSGWAFQLT